MWHYIRHHLPAAIAAALFMIGEVLMDLLQPQIMSRIVDEGVLGLNTAGSDALSLILHLGLIMIVLVLFGGLCGSLNNVFVHITGQSVGNDMRKDCFRKIMGLSFRQVDQYSTGGLITRVTNDITQVQNLVSQFVRGMIRTTMLTFGSLFFMFRLNRLFGIVVLCAVPFLLLIIVVSLCRSTPLFEKLQAQLDELNNVMQEDISGIRMIKACVRELYEKARFGKANDALIHTQLRVLVIFALMNPLVNALMYLVVAGILLLGSVQIQSGAASPGTIMAAITYTTQLLNGLLMLVMLFQNISRGMASWSRVRELLDTETDLKDGTVAAADAAGTIELRDVSFAYDSKKPVLEHLNLTIYPGETLAIMGATGCGKSTLVNLLPRFYDVTGGSILVDGVDVRDYKLDALRQKFAVVLQKAVLFQDTVSGNIAWGNPDAAMEEIKTSAQTAQADGFLSDMPEGYETQVAAGGVSLSGGQRQRLSIARALLRHGEFLVLDDATSALDLHTEARFYQALQQQCPNSTIIMVAQRVASARYADRIAVLDGGHLVACDSHENLMKTCPIYQDIYASQISGEEDAQWQM